VLCKVSVNTGAYLVLVQDMTQNSVIFVLTIENESLF